MIRVRFFKAIAILIIILSFSWFWNYDNSLNVHILKYEFTMSQFLYSALIFVLGFVSAVIASFGTALLKDLRNKEYEKKLSSTSVDTNKYKSKIEALERKIATLEKALESKLDK